MSVLEYSFGYWHPSKFFSYHHYQLDFSFLSESGSSFQVINHLSVMSSSLSHRRKEAIR